MLDNHHYNLINQLSQESKSLWRIKNSYLEDAKKCDADTEIWEKLAAEKMKCIAALEEQLKKNM